MVQDTIQKAAEPATPGMRSRSAPMPMCPMATMCKGMMDKRPSGLLLMLAGAALIAVGVLIFREPRVLVWLLGTGFVLLGGMLFMVAGFVRKLGVGPQRR